MKDAVIMLNIEGKIDEESLKKLQEQFPQITEIKVIHGPYNMRLRLESGTVEELKEIFADLNPHLKNFRVTDELIVANDW